MVFLHSDTHIAKILANAKAQIEEYAGCQVKLRLIEDEKRKTRLSQAGILQLFCDTWDVPVSKVTNQNRKAERVAMRQVCILFMRCEGYTLQSIGDVLGNRDHTTIKKQFAVALVRLEQDDDLLMHYYVTAEEAFENHSIKHEPKKAHGKATA